MGLNSLKIQDYFNKEGNKLSFSREQGSTFAKREAGDFNPIHNVDTRRFCVPGDLLFSVVLHCEGLYQSMSFEFEQLVTDTNELEIVWDGSDKFVLQDESGKIYLQVAVAGEQTRDETLVSALSRAYIEFSGVTFPYLLVDLMRNNGVMINPVKPLVMYKSMSFTLDRFSEGDMSLDYTGGWLSAEGKKAEVGLPFGICDKDETIGQGSKKMLLGSLRPFDDDQMDPLVEQYNAIKGQFSADG